MGQGHSLGSCLFGDFPASHTPPRDTLAASLPRRVQVMQRNGVVEESDGLSGLQQPALSDLASLVEEHLPVLPSAKEMGVSPAACRAVCKFRAQMALIRLQAEVCETDEVMLLVMEAIELEDYITSGAFSKQGNPLERWDRVELLLSLAKHFLAAAGGAGPTAGLCCEAGNMPFEGPNETPQEAEEEVRCAYVALTRAKRRLYITYAAERIEFGMRNHHVPSEMVGLIGPPKKPTENTAPKTALHSRRTNVSNLLVPSLAWR
ncbi:hypothetical protein WJX84_007273 [Apatococcus fuscideae]|uniref:UvrD-like helicase C-terminal domain-containing protein n=1 Tax=Apatococcus fuscideae TaxID=2026836 RepID=A0AAW1RMT9_9CHLO